MEPAIRHYAALLVCIIMQPVFSGTACAEIYKWIDANGHVQFTDKPPRNEPAETVKLKRINTIRSVSVSELPGWAGSDRTVTIYTTTWCGVCVQAKHYFKQRNIPYEEYDIETSSKGRKDFRKLKGTGVPVILIGNKRMNGFTAQRFESLYGG